MTALLDACAPGLVAPTRTDGAAVHADPAFSTNCGTDPWHPVAVIGDGGLDVLPGTDGERPAVLTVDEAARVLRISRSLAFAAVRDGSIPSVRIGRRILVPRARLEALLADGEGAGSQVAGD